METDINAVSPWEKKKQNDAAVRHTTQIQRMLARRREGKHMTQSWQPINKDSLLQLFCIL